MTHLPGILTVVRRSLWQALPSTKKSCTWLFKLMIPISLAVTLMQHFGILQWLGQYLNAVFVHLGLPGESAVVFLSGATAGTYAGIAAMMSIPLTMKQASILATMIALCHALPMECAVNRMTGSSFWRMAVIRILMALLCALLLNALLPAMEGMYLYMGAPAHSSFGQVMATWAISQAKMLVMVFLIVYALMIVQCLLEAYSLTQALSRRLSPVMAFFGLPRQSAYMWLVGNVLGISYGSAVMLDLEQRGLISRHDANDVNYHLIMNHSMLEDTIVFAVTGISAVLLISVRVTFAFTLVWTRRLLRFVGRRLRRNYSAMHG